jgi:hypothetical protein
MQTQQCIVLQIPPCPTSSVITDVKQTFLGLTRTIFLIVRMQADVIKPDLGEHDFAVILRLGELHVLHIFEPVVQVQPPQQVVTKVCLLHHKLNKKD